MKATEAAAALLEEALAAESKGQMDWRPYREAVAVFRAKKWSWPEIYARLVAVGAVPPGVNRLASFRVAMCQHEARVRRRAQARAAEAAGRAPHRGR